MKIIDFHVDTLIEWLKNKEQGKDLDANLCKNNYHVDFERLIKAGYSAQFFACFLDMENLPIYGVSQYDDTLKAIDVFHDELSKNTDKVAFAGSYKDYKTNLENKKLSAFLTVEEGGILDNDINRLDVLFDKGVRAITLTWNFENCIGYPNYEFKHKDEGLKPFGIETVEKMNELGIIIDVSHLSDGGFYDVCKYSKKPFMATHSNARVITEHSRNLTDDMIKKLADTGSITGLNFCGAFLRDDKKSTVEAMLRHTRHIINIGGLEVIGFGTDFDGIGGNLELKGAHDMHKLIEAMEANKFSSKEIECICYKNAENFFERFWS